MTGVQILACFWTLLLIQSGFVSSDVQFLERHEGESVVLPCQVEPRNLRPYGVYLKRSWLRRTNVLFMYTESDPVVDDDADQHRVGVSGDPSSHGLNVTISQLRLSDTDKYHCEFYFNKPSSEDERVRGNTDFFLLVTADAPASLDIGLVETCAGGSAVLPCLPPNGEGLAVEGVSLKRQRGRAPVELLYHSKGHRGTGLPSSSSSSSSSSQFPPERALLSSAPGPGGFTYNLTLQQLQPEESGLYSCQLLVHGRPETTSTLGRRVFFVSVQGRRCSCSSYSTLLYAVSAAAALLLLSVLIGLVVIYKGKAQRRVKSHPQAPIYEEMVGGKPPRRKSGPHQETESSEYRNCPVKKSCQENHYESPSGALYSRT